MFPHKPVYVVKNSIDFDIWDKVEPWQLLPPKKEGVVRIGYTGCGNHNGDLEVIKKALVAIINDFENVEIVMSCPFPILDDIQHPRFFRSDRWVSMPKYPSLVKGWDLDVGIAPLRDTNFNRAKSNLRWLEYSALSLPTVASEVYPFKNSIEHGKTGFVIGNSNKVWYDTLKDLIQDKEKRVKVGQEAYKEVKKNYNLEEVSKGYLSILKEVKAHELRSTVR